MKNWFGVWLLTICTLFLWARDDDPGQKDRNPDVSENVEVVNIEMIARVQKNGQPVGGLQKDDFVLTEKGRKVEINGFREVRRRISRPPANEEKMATAAPASAGRLFLLCFWLWDREAAYAEALDHFFSDIFRPGDSVILAHTKDTVLINSPAEIAPVRAKFEAELKKGVELDNFARIQLYDEIDKAVSDYLNRHGDDSEPAARTRLQKSIDNCWNEFRMKFLKSDSGSLIRLADSMKSINKEKWVLVFLQEEVFPNFSENENVPAIRNRLEEMKKSLGDGNDAFNDKVRSSFITAGATISLIRLNPNVLEAQGRSLYYRPQVVYSSRDECFQQISRVTGGAVITDNDMTRALGQAADKEDICYVLSFAPDDIRKKREMSLTCPDKSLDVIASRQIDSEDPREMTIANASITNSRLTFSLRGYARLFEAGRLQGRVLVRVVARDSGSLYVENSREFTLSDAVVQIPVELRLPREKKYAFSISVRDHISGREVVKNVTLRNNIPPTIPVKIGR
jgi:hypothetical protein